MIERDDPRWASQASYDFRFLSLYDITTLGIANRFVWGCPTGLMKDRYDRYQGPAHLDVGPASGFYLERSSVRSTRLVLLDLNRNVLQYCAKRLAHFEPLLVEGDVSDEALRLDGGFNSVGLNYVLHCIPLPPERKFHSVFDNVKRALAPGGVVFGATILGEGATRRSKKLQSIYNTKGIFNSKDDRRHHVENALDRSGFGNINVIQQGDVALFVAENL